MLLSMWDQTAVIRNYAALDAYELQEANPRKKAAKNTEWVYEPMHLDGPSSVPPTNKTNPGCLA